VKKLEILIGSKQGLSLIQSKRALNISRDKFDTPKTDNKIFQAVSGVHCIAYKGINK